MLFSKPLPVGSPAPSFICPDEEGQVFVLNQQRGKNVVLVFYPGDDTPVCTKQLCELRDQWERLESKDFAVFGVNPAEAGKHKKFREKHRFPFPLLVDNSQRVATLYKANGLWVKRTVYVIDKSGTIRYARRGKPPVDEILGALG
jgi:peroxiredoxin Q/BCP